MSSRALRVAANFGVTGIWDWTYETCRPAEETLGSTGVRNPPRRSRNRFLSRVLPYGLDSNCRTGSSGDSQAHWGFRPHLRILQAPIQTLANIAEESTVELIGTSVHERESSSVESLFTSSLGRNEPLRNARSFIMTKNTGTSIRT
jgi:hypothetical protein